MPTAPAPHERPVAIARSTPSWRLRRAARAATPALSVVAALALLTAASRSADAATFEIQGVMFCPTSKPLCGYQSQAAVDRAFRTNIAEVNLEYIPAGFSFHPLPTMIVVDDALASITKAGGTAGNGQPNKALTTTAWTTYAAPYPNRITLFMLPSVGPCWNGLDRPGKHPGTFAGDDVVYCAPPGDLNKTKGKRREPGTTYAHELGHFWCLHHTFTKEDPADADPLDVDGDDGLYGDGDPIPGDYNQLPLIGDTNPDPGGFEPYAADKSKPDDDAGEDEAPNGLVDSFWDPVHNRFLRNDHIWCQSHKLAPGVVDPVPGGAGDARAHTSGCSVDCFVTAQDQILPLPAEPLSEDALTYYGQVCRGPYVIGGQRIEAFTHDQIDVMHACRANTEQRTKLVDICKDHGGDTDHDGRCDEDDACPTTANAEADDTDHDGVPDACDVCPRDWCDLCGTIPDADQTDTDGDHIPDICDPDIDNDGCPNAIDAKPTEAFTVIDVCQSPYGWPLEQISYDGEDTDGDGKLDCFDSDDDGDGIPDKNDPCPLDTSGGPCLAPTDPCPLEPSWLVICHFLDCHDYELAVESQDPGPLAAPEVTPSVVFRDVHVAGTSLYLDAASGRTLSESALALDGVGGRNVALVLRTKHEHRAVTTLASYRAGTFDFTGDVARGRFLRIDRIPEGDARGTVAATWAIGARPDSPAPDSDGDGVPDFADDCQTVFDPAQADRDHDGFGDACDADLDQDGRVSASDVAIVTACLGFVVDHESEPACAEESPRDALVRAELPGADELAEGPADCERADLDGDGLVDTRDVAWAAASVARPLGPSGLLAAKPRAQTCISVQVGLPGSSVDNAHIADGTRANANFGAPTQANIATGSGVVGTRQALLRFDLSVVPRGAVVTAAKLGLSVLQPGGRVELHRATAPWSARTVTWNSFRGAFAAVSEASFVANAVGPIAPVDLRELVQSWVLGAPNDGIVLTGVPGLYANFYASGYGTVSARPRLDVCYIPL